jgi:hypothetical protein
MALMQAQLLLVVEVLLGLLEVAVKAVVIQEFF